MTCFIFCSTTSYWLVSRTTRIPVLGVKRSSASFCSTAAWGQLRARIRRTRPSSLGPHPAAPSAASSRNPRDIVVRMDRYYTAMRRDVEALAASRFDVAIVGGGITGLGIARDAALRGLRVALVERADFAEGTSSRSSKLAHGGLRYLEQGEFGLVRESVRERERLLRLAPHLVRSLAFLLPWEPGGGWPARPFLRAGLWLYDRFAEGGGGHRWLDA